MQVVSWATVHHAPPAGQCVHHVISGAGLCVLSYCSLTSHKVVVNVNLVRIR